MSGAGWFITLGIIYLVLLVVFAVLSFRLPSSLTGHVMAALPHLRQVGAG